MGDQNYTKNIKVDPTIMHVFKKNIFVNELLTDVAD